ncbi:MAG: DUF1186 domain-containing protein [Terracidiphilus sp.]
MEIPEILERFHLFDGKYEREAVAAAVERRDEIAPALLEILAEVVRLGPSFDPTNDRMDHLYAMFLLAQFREQRAYPLLLQIARFPGETIYDLFGDSTTEHLGKCLASVCGGDWKGLHKLIEDEVADEWARVAGFTAILTLVREKAIARAEAVEYFRTLFHGGLRDKNDVVWGDLVCAAGDLWPGDLIPEIEKAYEDGLIDPGTVSLNDVERDLGLGLDAAMERLAADPHKHYVTTVDDEMEWWACFHEKEVEAEKQPAAEWAGAPRNLNPPASLFDEEFGVPAPYRREGPKVGRNDPCPCGSGKKYKKCCGQ